MLIDEWLQALTNQKERKTPIPKDIGDFTQDEIKRQIHNTIKTVKRCQKFVASPLVIETASSLSVDTKAIEKSAPHFFLSAREMWLDLSAVSPRGAVPDARHGVLLISNEDNIKQGRGMLVSYMPRNKDFLMFGFTFNLVNHELYTIPFPHQMREWNKAGANIPQLINVVWSTIALINTPKTSIVMLNKLEKINRARLAAHKIPLLQYKQVNIRVDGEQFRNAIINQQTHERPMHHVRAFLRIVRGKVQLVRPHWRGNPRFGVIVHRYAVLRAEDEPGSWTGDMLPPSKIITELFEKESVE